MKLKVELKVMDCWELVIGTDLQPPTTAPAGADAAALTAALALRKTWDKKRDGAVAAIITSILDVRFRLTLGCSELPVI